MVKIMARRTKEDAEQTRELILITALDVFCEKGYSRTTFDEIAKRINLTKGAVYWHFRNKPDVIVALIREGFSLANDAITKEIPEVRNLDDLSRRFMLNADFIQNNHRYRKLLFFILYQMEWSEAMMGTVGESIEDIRSYPIRYIKEALTFEQKSGQIAPEVSIEETAEIIFAFWRGIIERIMTRRVLIDLSTMTKQCFDLIIKGLRVEGTK